MIIILLLTHVFINIQLPLFDEQPPTTLQSHSFPAIPKYDDKWRRKTVSHFP